MSFYSVKIRSKKNFELDELKTFSFVEALSLFKIKIVKNHKLYIPILIFIRFSEYSQKLFHNAASWYLCMQMLKFFLLFC